MVCPLTFMEMDGKKIAVIHPVHGPSLQAEHRTLIMVRVGVLQVTGSSLSDISPEWRAGGFVEAGCPAEELRASRAARGLQGIL